MRKSSKDVAFLADGNVIIGLNLGWDFTAEHEWGIARIQEAFGISGKACRNADGTQEVGVKVRSVKKVPADLDLLEDTVGGYLYLMYDSIDFVSKQLMRNGFKPYEFIGSEDLMAAWDGSTFGVRAKLGTDLEKNLRDVHKALIEKDALIFVGGRQVFGNGGLHIYIKSRMPLKMVQAIEDADLDLLELTAAAWNTGIAYDLRAAGKEYYALQPSWMDDSKKNVHFWLNPHEQQKYESGWFTVNDLRQWIKDKGPVVKREKKRVQK